MWTENHLILKSTTAPTTLPFMLWWRWLPPPRKTQACLFRQQQQPRTGNQPLCTTILLKPTTLLLLIIIHNSDLFLLQITIPWAATPMSRLLDIIISKATTRPLIHLSNPLSPWLLTPPTLLLLTRVDIINPTLAPRVAVTLLPTP